MNLEEFFKEYPKVAVACSGGVDSIYLMSQAIKYAGQVKVYFVDSDFQPRFELEDALKACEQLNVKLQVIRLEVLEENQIILNPKNRCYYCKQKIFGEIISAAKKDGFSVILDGTNASDDADDRPGMKAIAEMKVLSPLRICGYTKAMIREGARIQGLDVWDKPSYACLATRIPTGTAITKKLLIDIEGAERVLFDMGFTDFRIRVLGDMGRIQVLKDQKEQLVDNIEEIRKRIEPYFKDIVIDEKTR